MMVMRADRRSPSAPWTHKTCRDHALPRADPPTIRHPPENPPAGPRGLGAGGWGWGQWGPRCKGSGATPRRIAPDHGAPGAIPCIAATRPTSARVSRHAEHPGRVRRRSGPGASPGACRNQARRWLPDPRRGPGARRACRRDDPTPQTREPAARPTSGAAAQLSPRRAAIRPDGGDEVPGKARGCAEPVDGTTRPPAHRNPPSVRHRQHRRRPRDHPHRSGRGRGRPAPRG